MNLLLIVMLILLPIWQLQPPAADVIVTLRDSNGTGISGAAITVRDAEAGRIVATATSDDQGQTRFSTLEATNIRIVVTGRLTDGTQLRQRGGDTSGLWVLLDTSPVTIDLRAEPDGVVIPDPGTMITRDSITDSASGLSETPALLATATPRAALGEAPPVTGTREQSVGTPSPATPGSRETLPSQTIVAVIVIALLIILLLAAWQQYQRGRAS